MIHKDKNNGYHNRKTTAKTIVITILYYTILYYTILYYTILYIVGTSVFSF